MEYINKTLKKAFGPTWTIFAIIAAVATLLGDAIWGEGAPVQFIAWGVGISVALILIFRIFCIAPYQLWKEDQSTLSALAKTDVDPLKAKRDRLLYTSANLFTSAKTINSEWSVSDERQRENLSRSYRGKRKSMTSLADHFSHDEIVYRAAQDAINRCDILITDAEDGLPNQQALLDAYECTKVLQGSLLVPYNTTQHRPQSEVLAGSG
jgi:hypothetical protein